ncbi:MAG: helix-turn-helix transcriptional regulator [Sphingomonadales bacterium]|nr:helix-turn-helix transcriptional regulator [Sphingomonadales bacterium]
MIKRVRPAVDEAISAGGGTSRDGQPISYNRSSIPELRPWISRLYATVVTAPDDYRLSCGLLNDTCFLRIQLQGEWTAETGRGPLAYARAALFFGPQSRRMPVSVTGSFTSIGVSLRPGACHAFKGPKIPEHVDAIVRAEDIGLSSEALIERFPDDADPERWLQELEAVVRERVEAAGGAEPDPVTRHFESVCLADPNLSISEIAEQCGVELRKLERIVRRDFGMAPKQALRRARALDMASHLRGVADQAEAEDLILRYYDQSHLIREFVDLFGMSPGQFVARPQPLLTLALESRQARRLEALERIVPGQVRPWQ